MELLPFVLFAFVASITPGPTNVLVLSNSARFGWRAALPIIFGACAAAAGLVLLVGLGFGDVLSRHPQLQRGLSWVGIAWLSYLAWRIFTSPVTGPDSTAAVARLGVFGAAGLQLVNPKTWMMALAVIGVFAAQETDADKSAKVMQLAMIFFLVALPCLGVWALLGRGASRLYRTTAGRRRFNQTMGVLLLVSAWLSLLG